MEQHPSKPLPSNQLAFEQAAMEEICFGLGTLGDIVREQYVAAKVVERWGSGAGFYTDFEVSPHLTKLPADTPRTFGSSAFQVILIGETDCLQDGYGMIGCHLHQSDGLINCLECFNFGNGDWPTDQYIWRDAYFAQGLGTDDVRFN